MKITPVAAPADIKQVTTNNTDARAKAIAAFNTGKTSGEAQSQAEAPTQGQAQEYAVANPNQVSAEEMSAIKAPSQPTEIIDNNTTEVAQEAKAETKAVKDPETERQFAELARQERILRSRAQKQAQELQTQKAALDAQKAALDAQAAEYKQGYISKDKFKADPLAALAEAEMSYEELTNQLLTQKERDPRVEARMDRLEAENRALKAEIESGKTETKQQQVDNYQAALRQIERDATELIQQDPAMYEAITKTKNVKAVVRLIEKTFNEDGRVMSVEEAAEAVENHIIEEGLNTVSKIDKIKKRLAQSASEVEAKAKQVNQQTQAKPQQTQNTMKTLTNATSSTRQLSARERAVLAFKGELK